MSDNNVSCWGSLPDEMQTQILIRLPIKSIITCTSVCKTWKSLIQNPPSFPPISTTPTTTITTSSSGSTKMAKTSKKNTFCITTDDFTEHTRFDFPLESHKDEPIFRVVGTCNSMICLSHNISKYIDELFLWNPCVRKFVKLPSPNGTLLSSHVAMEHASIWGLDLIPKTMTIKW
jgi:hypothetical protein